MYITLLVTYLVVIRHATCTPVKGSRLWGHTESDTLFHWWLEYLKIVIADWSQICSSVILYIRYVTSMTSNTYVILYICNVTSLVRWLRWIMEFRSGNRQLIRYCNIKYVPNGATVNCFPNIQYFCKFGEKIEMMILFKKLKRLLFVKTIIGVIIGEIHWFCRNINLFVKKDTPIKLINPLYVSKTIKKIMGLVV